MMTKSEFISWARGKKLDYDGVPSQPFQCVDEVKFYLDKCYQIKNFSFTTNTNPHGYAKGLWYDFDKYPQLKGKFIKIKNTKSFIPKKGDIVEWDEYAGVTGIAGHTAVSEGKNSDSTSQFTSLDQNWGGKLYCTDIIHNFKGVLGVIRPLQKCTTAALNVRTGAGTNYPIVQKNGTDYVLPKGTLVLPIKYKNNWAQIGENEWVSSNYLD